MTRAGRRAPSIGTEPPRSSSGRSAGNQPVFCRPAARDGSSSARRAFRRCLNWSARRHSISFNAGHHKAADELTLENEERYERWCNDEHSCGGQSAPALLSVVLVNNDIPNIVIRKQNKHEFHLLALC